MARTDSTENQSNGKRPLVNREPAIAVMRALNSILGDRFNMAKEFGLQYPTTDGDGYKRHMQQVLGYDDQLTFGKYQARYARGGIAERIVEAYPLATWSGGAVIVEDDNPEVETPFEAAVADLFAKHQVWAKLLKADILAGLGSYGVILIGAEGETPEPLEASGAVNPEKLLYLQPLGEDKATVSSWVKDTQDARFGLPEFYDVKVDSGDIGRKVHWSRVLHITEGTLDNETYGKPRLRAIWNYLDDLDKIVGGGAEAAWKRADPGMQLDLDPEAELGTVEEDALQEEVDKYLHGVSRVMRTRGLKINQLAMAVHSFGPNADTLLQLISATTGIPYRILTGSERGELASTQDRNNWNERVAERRRLEAEPTTMALVDRFIEVRFLPEPAEPYRVDWPERDELTESEKASVAKTLADANKAQVDSGDTAIITSAEIRSDVFDLGTLEEGGGEEGDEEDQEAEDQQDEQTELEAAAEHANREAMEAEWKVTHRVAEANEEQFAAVLTSTWAAASMGLIQSELEDLIKANDAPGVTDLARHAVNQVTLQTEPLLRAAYQRVMQEAGDAHLDLVERRGTFVAAAEQPAGISFRFDAARPEAEAWAATQSSGLIVEVSDEVILGVQALVASGIREGIAPRALARNIRDIVGLREDQVTAVTNLRAQLSSARPGTMVTRFPPRPGLRNQAGFRVRIPPGGLTEAQVSARVAQYERMQLNLRARTIARTETIRAANEGQREMWRQAQSNGTLGTDATRVWISTPDERVRPEHADRDGVEVGVNEEWPWGTEPGQEVNCRCGQGIKNAGRNLARAIPLLIPPPTGEPVEETA